MLETVDLVTSAKGQYSYAEGADPAIYKRIVFSVGDGRAPEDSDRLQYGTVLVGTYAYINANNATLPTIVRVVPLFDTPCIVYADDLFGGPYQNDSGFPQWMLYVIPRVLGWEFKARYYP